MLNKKNIYHRYCIPHLVNFACARPQIGLQRAKIVPLASGQVLEIGVGSGANLVYYDPERVERVWCVEPSIGMRNIAEQHLRELIIPYQWITAMGENIPLEASSIDTVVMTYTLCSVVDWRAVLFELRRVLKPNGRLLFSEHGLAPDISVADWQNRLSPIWTILAGGCQLNRNISACLLAAGFNIATLEAAYLPGMFKLVGFNYRGVAINEAE